MKKLIVGLLPVMALMFTIVSAWVIKVEDATEKTSSCISSQSEDRYYYIAHDNYTVFPDDTFGNTVDSLISKGPDTSVQIWRNWILSDCNDWWRISTVVSASDSDGALVIANDDGCILNKPSYTKINNPTAIDAQIHYTIWYRKVFEWWANTLTSRLYHRNQGVNVWTCYPGWNTEADSDNCPKVSVKYGDQNYHKWECLNYRVFRCGDGLINRPDWTKNYNNWTYNEECDPNHPDWKNRTDWQSCNPNTCKIEYEAPVCSSNYNNKKVYTNNSTPYLKGLDSENLCNLWKLTQNTFRQIWTPIQYTWWCTNGTQSTSSNECKFKQYRCGDGEVNWWWDWSSFINGAHYEQCDPEASEWKNRTDWQKCNSSCNIEYTASCGRLDRDDAKYNSNYPSQRITENSAWLCDMWQVKAWSFKYDKETWKYTWDCVNGNSTDKCEAQDLWCGDWEKNGTEQCDYKDTDKKEWWGWKRETCNDKCVREPIPQEGPVCDSSFSGHTEYTTYSSDWLNRNSWLCTRWQVTYFNSEWSTWSQRKFTWKCNNDDLDITCTAKQEWCGDGEKNWGEVCDPNDTVNKKWWWDAWCSSTCDKAIYDSGVCGSKYKEKKTYLDISKDWITDTTPGLCDKWDVTNFYKHSSSHVYTWQCDNHWNISDTCRADQEWCGDGVKNGWEQCDYKDQYEVNWWNDWCSTSCEKKIQPDNWECNDTFYYTLRYGWKYTFYDKFIPWGTRYLYDFSVKFDEKKPYDFNQWENPTFSWMEDLGDGVYKVVSTTRRVIKSQPQYEIKTHPNFGDSSYDDIYIEYTIKYSDKAYSPKPDDSMLKTHKECAYYKISRCGDGKIDTDWEGKREQDKAEECDPGSEETKVLPDGRICNADCTISDVPAPICNSQYSGQVVDNLTENDNLCSEWTYVPGSLHFDEATNTWTWECDNVAWKWVECSATKKVAPGWEPVIEKTLKDKVMVRSINQKLTWTVEVTAKWWDIEDFKVRDKLPKVLKYETYRIIKNEDNLKVSDKPSGPVESWSYNIYTWDVKWKLHEGHKLVIEIDSTVIKMPTKKDDYLNIACVEDDDVIKCDDDQPWTAEIVKELQDKKEVRYTWQELDWKVTVTAKWWDIEDFDIWDKMPVELEYEGWELDKKNTQNWITVTYDESRSPKLSWDVNIHYWDVKWVLYSGNKITMIVKSTVKRMPMSWEDILNIACVVQDGTEIDCDHDNPPTPKWEPKIEKTLKDKVIVKAVNQKLTWTVRVTAKWWDITDFKVRDKLPKVLKYETYRIVKNEDNLKLPKKPSGPVESWSNNIYTWDVEWTLHEGNELVIEIDSTVIKMPTKKDDYLNIACVEDDDVIKCDDDQPWTAEIVKELQDKKEVRYTWQELDWKVTVTAKWWDIEDFDIWDKMPVELEYEGWELDKKNTQNWITVTYDESRSPKLSWDVNIHYWDVKWVLYSGNKITMIVKSTVKRMPMSWEDILNIACVVQDGTEIDCDHDNPPKWDWKLTIDKTLVWKQTVENTGDILEWEIKVTASWWAVTWWFKISDIVPYVLEFTWVYSVKYNPAGLKMWKWYKWDMSELRTWKWETLTGEVWTLDVSWDMEKDQSLILRVTTKVIKMPKNDKEYRNVACVIKDWKVDCDGDEPEMKPNVKIEKHILNKDWKEVDSITWNVNDKITYIIRFENNGDVGLFVTLKDYLPKSVDFLSGELIVWKTTYKWETSTWNFATVYNWEKIQVDGITINKYAKVYLKAWEGWVLTVVGQIKEPKDEKESRTNFACIFDDDGNEIACDDAHHNIEKNVSCKPDLSPASFDPVCTSDAGEFSTTVTCKTAWWKADIEIWCDGKSIVTWHTNLLTWTCSSKEHDKDHKVQCKINNSFTWANWEVCEKSFRRNTKTCGGWWTTTTVTPGSDPDPLSCKSMDYDSVSGIAKCTPSEKAYIKIDCGNEKIYTSKEKEPNAKYDCGWPATPKCYVSDDKKEWVSSSKCWDLWCFNINAWNFSIEEWEILPFYWNMNNMDEKYKQKGNYIEINDNYKNPEEKYDNPENYSCAEGDQWKIAKDSMVCVFNIYDGDKYHKWEYKWKKDYNNPLYTIEWPCLASPKALGSSSSIKKKPLIESWYDTMINVYCGGDKDACDFHYNETENDALFPTAVYYIEKFWWDAQVPYTIEWWDRELKWNLQGKTDKALWEYKLELSEVRYLECGENGKLKQAKNTNACQSNFVLTNSYTVQKTPSWNLTASTDELSKYRDYNRANNRAYTFDKFINAIKTTDYKANQHVESAMKTFIDKYSKLAVNVDVWANSFLNGANVRKVPWKSIYFVDGDITIKWWTVKKPFTIVQTKGKTTINWNVQNNMMLLTLWDIEFKWTNCQNDQIVQWIFYAKGSLQRDQRYRNDNIDGTWCTNWWLHVKWVLIWNNFNTLMDWSRSNLNDWFKVNWSEQDISNQRKNMIMNWASVVIEYSPSIFTKSTMPPGAKDFTTALDIYKK